jgi:hypothetical protein
LKPYHATGLIPCELSIEQQFVIIRWFVKTVMTHELTGDIPHFFKPNERKAIMDNAVIIEADALIFLARHVGSQDIRSRTYYIPLLVGYDADRPVGAEGYTTTFAFKNLVLQIFAVRRPLHLSDSEIGVNLRGNWGTATVQIWPISGSITWPPPFFFDDNGFELFINRWSKLTTPP